MGDLMPWTQRFIDELAAGRKRPRFVVDSLSGFGLPGEFTAIRWSTHNEAGYTQCITDACSLGPTELSVGTCTVSPMQFTAELTRNFSTNGLRRGYVVELRMGFDGWDVSDYEPIFIGVLKSLTYNGTRARYMVTFVGLEGNLNTRWGLGGAYPDKPDVFSDLEHNETTLDAAWLVGSTTIDFATGTGPKRVDGGLYTVRVTNNAGTTFLMQGDTLTTPSAGVTRLENLTFGVMDSAAPSGSFSAGNKVEYLAWDEEHPLRIAQRLVTSSFGSGNGSEDVYPAEWGLQVPASHIDESDWSQQRILAGPDLLESPSWHLLQDAPATTFGQWLSGFLSDGGFFLCQRQGKMTGRAIQLLESQAITLKPNDRDIKSIEIEHFGGEIEYRRTTVVDHGMRSASVRNPYDPTAQLSDTVARLVGAMTPRLPPVVQEDYESAGYIGIEAWSRPTSPEKRIVLPVYGSSADRSRWRSNVLDRLFRYYNRVPERIKVTLPGLHWAMASLGDAVGLTTTIINSRRGPNDLITKGGWHTVVRVGMDPFNNRCTYTLLGVPEDSEG